jgi:cystathionine beta-lyase
MPEHPESLPHFDTICTHLGENPAEYKGAATPPLFQNSLFTFPDCETRERNYSLSPEGGTRAAGGVSEMYDYSRVCNPTTDIVEAKIAALEGGERARCFGSGMGAVSAAIMACVKAGDHVIAPETVYGPTRQFLRDYLRRFDVSVTFVDGTDPQHWQDALKPNTTLLMLESPSSVVMKQQDLAAVTSIARTHGAATVIDNSWATPIFQNPLALGVDLVAHSATKYLGGHSDIVAGVVVGSAERMKKITFEEGCLLGAVLDPFAAWLLLRGLRTLPIRMERHQQSARRIAHSLLEHPTVEQVFYPGIPTDPQLALTQKQLRGTSGLLSFALKEQGKKAAHRTVDALKYFGIGCSWGGFESLALPSFAAGNIMESPHAEGRWVIRLHIGLENVEDLWDDLSAALKAGL